jgi:hypothetical protein
VAVGAALPPPGVVYARWSTGATLPSCEDARRSPLPESTNASALPGFHPVRPTISCTIDRKSEVR